MYTAYFGFRETPFNATPDPRFFFVNEVYQEAYANLRYGVLERKGFIVLTGEVGTGKTTLIRRLIDNLEATIRSVFVWNTIVSFEELLADVCGQLGLKVEGLNRLQRLRALEGFLSEQFTRRGTVVLFVDEAQNLSDDALENLRLLSNLETPTQKLLQIVLVGQPELDTRLAQASLRQLRQRVVIRARLGRLHDAEVAAFIDFRLRAAGYEGHPLFGRDAVRRIAALSGGIPRLINIICDNALLIAFATSQAKISAKIIDEASRDLQVSGRASTASDQVAPRPPARVRTRQEVLARRRAVTPGRRWGPRVGLGLAILLLVVAGGFVATRAGFIDKGFRPSRGDERFPPEPASTPSASPSLDDSASAPLELPARPALEPPAPRTPRSGASSATDLLPVAAAVMSEPRPLGPPEPKRQVTPAPKPEVLPRAKSQIERAIPVRAHRIEPGEVGSDNVEGTVRLNARSLLEAIGPID
jgi:general secretion pathway protein A